MSQQTQVSRVIPKYETFLDVAPDFQTLATLDKHTLLSLRSGLGYNNRALRLQQTAQIVMSEYGGELPQDEKSLLGLPWIGPYTAHAVMAFARNIDVPVVDINIRRVLITMIDLPKEISDRDLRDIAIACVPPGQSRVWHNALMDYGAMVLTGAKTGIKSAPQSTFKGSKRWVRWSILKALVQHKQVSLVAMKQSYPHKDFDSIIESMMCDKLLHKEGDIISIAS
jgi:A/G-specific adenine glycosylase